MTDHLTGDQSDTTLLLVIGSIALVCAVTVYVVGYLREKNRDAHGDEDGQSA